MNTSETQTNGAESEPSRDGYTVAPEHFTPPYASWTTLTNLVEKIAKEGGLPSQIDRSYLSNLPGSTQTPLIAALKSLRLVDESLRPTEDLETWVSEVDERQGLVKAILEIHYPGPLGLGKFATQQQLENEFRKFGVSGSTMRKSIAFFLAAAKFAELSLSPHFRVPKQTAADGPAPRQRKQRPAAATGNQNADTEHEKPPAAELPPAMKHELIAGLIRELPEPGAAFPEDKQDAWFAIAKATFRLIYNTSETDRGTVRPNVTPPGSED